MTATRTEKEARFWREILVKLDAEYGLNRLTSCGANSDNGCKVRKGSKMKRFASSSFDSLENSSNFRKKNHHPTIFDIFNRVQKQKIEEQDIAQRPTSEAT